MSDDWTSPDWKYDKPPAGGDGLWMLLVVGIALVLAAGIYLFYKFITAFEENDTNGLIFYGVLLIIIAMPSSGRMVKR